MPEHRKAIAFYIAYYTLVLDEARRRSRKVWRPDAEATSRPSNRTSKFPGESATLAETSIEQARKALDSLIGAAHRAIDETEHRVDTAQGGVRELSRKTIGFAEANVAASFDFAARLVKARTLDEWVKLHSEFAMEQTRRFSEQVRQSARAVPHWRRAPSRSRSCEGKRLKLAKLASRWPLCR